MMINPYITRHERYTKKLYDFIHIKIKKDTKLKEKFEERAREKGFSDAEEYLIDFMKRETGISK